jgi:hypothetical protein
MLAITLTALLLTAAAVTIIILVKRLRSLSSQHAALAQEHTSLQDRFRPIIDAEAERQRIIGETEAQRQHVLDEIRMKQESAEAELKATRQRELGTIESDRTRIMAEIDGARAEQQRELQSYQEQRRNREAEKFNLELSLSRLREEFKALDEEANLQSFGFYKPRYDFATSVRYQTKLEEIRERQKQMIKDKTAAVCQIEWAVNGNRAEGRKQTNQTLKLILRAFNGESDAAITKVKYNNIHVMEARISKAFEAINSLVGVQQCLIVKHYLDLKLQELYLVHEYQEKVQEEKEEQRRIREQMREEELAQRELERAKQDAERDEQRYAEALRKASQEVERAVGEKQQKLLGQIEELQKRLTEAQANKERAISRAQMTRAGHVYIISNIGSFGEHVYKIGMTRRLDPMDRVRELGDASVPFGFDVHAIIYSDDAPTLENTLHRVFNQRRVNRINARKEFFRVSIEEIAGAVRQHHGEIEMILDAEAVEYRKTLAMLSEGQISQTSGVLALTADSGVSEQQAESVLPL